MNKYNYIYASVFLYYLCSDTQSHLQAQNSLFRLENTCTVALNVLFIYLSDTLPVSDDIELLLLCGLNHLLCFGQMVCRLLSR